MGLLDANAPQWLPIDGVGGRITIDLVHHEIHDGNHYTFSRTKVMDTVTENTVIITTPAAAGGSIHIISDAEMTAAGSWTFSKVPEASAGSTLTAYNNNFISSSTSGTTIQGGVIWTSAGTIVETHYIGANNTSSKTGGNVAGRNEYILSPSTKYGFRVANNAATCYSVINLFFYVA